ncbi:ATP-binding protein [Streptomyces sp. NPDC001667]
MHSSAEHLRRLRRMAGTALRSAGVTAEVAEKAQLVTSELIGNAVARCGAFVPLVVEILAEAVAVSVKVHDPDGSQLPLRGLVRLDDPEAESGRGLPLLDLLAPGWNTVLTPVGKQVHCRVPYEEPTTAAEEGTRNLPFSVRFDPTSQEVVVTMAFGDPPWQRMRRKTYSSPEAVIVASTNHQHEAFLQAWLASELASTATRHLGPDPKRFKEVSHLPDIGGFDPKQD